MFRCVMPHFKIASERLKTAYATTNK